jgi:ribosomal protein S12 methylthiotransferase accessory factor
MRTPTSPIDERTGLIRWVFDLPIEPGEPKIFNASVKMADTERYAGVPCYDSNGGSGLTAELARGAAVGEGLERYCASLCDPAALVFGSARALADRYTLCPPEAYALFHPEQTLPFPHFDDTVPLAWVTGYSLTHHRPTLVPACLVYIPYFPHFPGEQSIGPAVSSGMACAKTYEEALLKGLCEAIERDAFVITWLNRLSAPEVDFTAHPQLDALYHQRLQSADLHYRLIEMTTDLSVPSFLCLLVDERRETPMICAGGASHLDPVMAAQKALLEAVQTREWAKYLGQSRSFERRADFSNVRTFEEHVALYAFGNMRTATAFLLDRNQPPPPLNVERPYRSGGNAAQDLDYVLGLMTAAGLEVIALDLTTADVAQCGYCVTKVLVPGLQPLFADHQLRFLGGERLYETPRRLGYGAERRTFDSLNPFPHPYP